MASWQACRKDTVNLEAIVKQDVVGTPVCRIALSDISEQKFREDMGEIATLLASQINTSKDLCQRMSNLTTSLQNWSACEAVGIRLKDGDDYPYYETRGFPASFVQAETHLCVHGTNGEILRDSTGNPVLECMCGNILRGRFDPAKPFFTANGSFWSNSTTALLASTTEADRQSRTRNRCNGEGYESVALIPLRVDNQILGLLQFNDHRPDRFSSALIAHFEKIAGIVAIALWRSRTEERLQKSENHYRLLFNSSLIGVTVTDRSFIFIDVNDAFCTMLEYSKEEIVGKMTISDVSHPDDAAKSMEMGSKQVKGEIDRFSLEKRYVSKSGKIIHALIYVRGFYDSAGKYEGATASVLDMTEKIKTDEMLRESEEKYRTLFNNAEIALFRTRLDGSEILDVNRKYLDIVGKTREEILGKPSIIVWVDPEERKEMVRKLVADGKVSDFEFRMLHKQKGVRNCITSLALYQDTGILEGSIVDITERKRIEEELLENSQRLQLATASGKLAIWDWNVKDNIMLWDDRMFELYGISRDTFSSNIAAWMNGLHPDDKQRAIDESHAALLGEKEFNSTFRVLHPDGTIKHIEAAAMVVRDKKGKAIRMIGINSDITERKQAEASYQTLFREMLDGFALHEIICDKAGVPIDYRFLAVNPAFERMTGLSVSDVVGRTVLEVIPGIEKHWIETYGRVALTGEPNYFENFAKDLKKHFQVTAFCPQQGQFANIFVDITHRKKAEDERQKLEQQLQQAQKMEAIGTLAGGIAHDFNNILGAILGYAEMIQEDSPTGSTLRGDIDQVVKASHRAKDLVKQILAFSRQAETQKIPMRPAAMVKESMKLLRASIPTTIDVQQDIDSETDLILADPTQFHQMTMNLCTNAYHAMEETGGILLISLKNKVLAQQDLLGVPDVQPGHFIQFSIRDTGSGIAPEIRERIFDPYFTTKEAGKGTGMGLAIVHGIAKSYGGFITCHSEIGAGTVFEIYLPAVLEQIVPETKEFELIPLGTERILFIDDEEILVKMGQTLLERLGYKVTTKMSSIEALATFKNKPDAFDLVITDQTMPGMTGVDLARSMLHIQPNLPIILCTGYSTQISKDNVKSYGIKGFALKPLARKDIAALIRKVLDEGKLIS